jgi:hypothetical protein
MTTTTNIMGFLDENKDDIPEGLYLKFCNLLKKENEEEHKEESRFYNVKYIYTECDPHRDGIGFNMRMCQGEQIIKLENSEYDEIKDTLTIKKISSRYAYKINFHNHMFTHAVNTCDEGDLLITMVSNVMMIDIEEA